MSSLNPTFADSLSRRFHTCLPKPMRLSRDSDDSDAIPQLDIGHMHLDEVYQSSSVNLRQGPALPVPCLRLSAGALIAIMGHKKAWPPRTLQAFPLERSSR